QRLEQSTGGVLFFCQRAQHHLVAACDLGRVTAEEARRGRHLAVDDRHVHRHVMALEPPGPRSVTADVAEQRREVLRRVTRETVRTAPAPAAELHLTQDLLAAD